MASGRNPEPGNGLGVQSSPAPTSKETGSPMAFQASCAELVPAPAGEPPTAKCGPLAIGTLDAINKTDFGGWVLSAIFADQGRASPSRPLLADRLAIG